MPELPDITIYIGRLEHFVGGKVLEKIRFLSPFVLRTYDPPIESAFGKKVNGFRRLGKRIVFALDDEFFLVVHLMVTGRLYWKKRDCSIPKGRGLAAFDFPNGTLLLTESGKKKKASIHLVHGREHLDAFNPGGQEILDATLEEFRQVLTSENHTLKRALTDPWLFSGVGNAYSDEILLAAGLSPVQQSGKMSDEQIEALFVACRQSLTRWTDRLRDEVGEGFPENVTAFHPDMAAHGKYGKPCPRCGTAIQRIVYAENETNYCPRCQTGGKLLADRALSKLLHKDWPRTMDELEAKTGKLNS